jgi:glutathione S-transferase
MPALIALKRGGEEDLETIRFLLGVLDRQLSGNTFILGELSVVDFAITSYLITKTARRLDYSATPNVAAWLDRMVNLRGFTATQSKPSAP